VPEVCTEPVLSDADSLWGVAQFSSEPPPTLSEQRAMARADALSALAIVLRLLADEVGHGR
jgi:hypothetical protein